MGGMTSGIGLGIMTRKRGNPVKSNQSSQSLGYKYLIVQFLIGGWQRDCLLPDIAVAVESNRLAPVVERAGDKDLIGSIRPVQSRRQQLDTRYPSEWHE